MSIQALSSLPAPSGGAVRLIIYSSSPEQYALILASPDLTPPDPIMQAGARKVYGGKLTARVPARQVDAPHAYYHLDLDSDHLKDDTLVYYHIYELHPNGTYGPPLTIHCVPNCARSAAVTIGRDIIKKRLRYHLPRAIEAGIVARVQHIPVLEQEVREEGQSLPSVFVKERVIPAASADTIGNQGGEYKDAHHPGGVKQFRFTYNASIDILILSDNPDERTDLEAYLRGALTADRELFMAAGIENPQISAFTTHSVEESTGNDLYGSEISISGQITTLVSEIVTQIRPHFTHRNRVTP